MEKIIENGLNSIRVGLEDYERALEETDDARLTSAVRNVYAGIVILAKGKLYELSPIDNPGILIRDMRPQLVDGRIELVANGRKTIGYDEIKKRFRHFALSLDWARIERVREIRNDLEHFYHDGSRLNVQEALADAAIAIRSLLVLLKLDPVRDFGERWWGVLLRNEKLFAAELTACRETFKLLNWANQVAAAASRHFSCERCGSLLIQQSDAKNVDQEDMNLICAACSAESEMRAMMARGVRTQHFAEWYEIETRGGELPVVQCPNCRLYTLITNANECAVCGNVLPPSTVWCDVCRNPMSPEEAHTNGHECPAFFQNQDTHLSPRNPPESQILS